MLTPVITFVLMQIGPNPMTGQIPDHSAEVQDRPPRTQPQNDIVGPLPDSPSLLGSADRSWLQSCLDLVETSPARAHVQAQLRRDSHEGPDRVVANYCLGLASSSLQLLDDARTAFVAARDEGGTSEPGLRARFGIMAGNAALAAGDDQRASALLSEAQRDAEGAGAGRLAAFAALDHARILVAQNQPEQAEIKLDDARRLDPQSGEAWLLSATLMRRLDRLEEAQSQIERAGILLPADQDVALEAGLIAVLSGRDDAARASWDSVIAIDSSTPQADTARGYLAQLGEAVPTP